MTVLGHVKNGVIVLDKPIDLPEGAVVQIEFAGNGVGSAEATKPDQVANQEATSTLYERLKPFIGVLKDLPPDASQNLDHYLYGTPKRS